MEARKDEISDRFFPTWNISKSMVSGLLSKGRWAKDDTRRQAQSSILCSTGNSPTALKGDEQAQQQQSACREEAGPRSSEEVNLAP